MFMRAGLRGQTKPYCRIFAGSLAFLRSCLMLQMRFVYALTDGNHRIIYAEEIFCNYYMDLDYMEYIPQEYLLDGFDASKDNPYRKKMMNE